MSEEHGTAAFHGAQQKSMGNGVYGACMSEEHGTATFMEHNRRAWAMAFMEQI
jgi:hypothetical protein